ncbi:MAG: uracil-DNA glycosylase family protein [Nostoc sp.]
MSEYLFSQFRGNEFEDLYQQLSEVFTIPKNELSRLYETMRKEFEMEGYPEHPLSKNIFNSSDESFQKSYDDAWLIGVDIPSILEQNDNLLGKRTVVILGQDPRRQSKERVEKITIGTPYALHLNYCREKHRSTRLYFDLIRVLLNEGYRVYLTDVFKIWVSESNNGNHNIPLIEQDQKRFIKILKAELEIFEPLAVITWGQVATTTVNSIGLSGNHFEFPHPSSANHKTWSNLMGKPATRANRINFWQEKVLAFLNKL